MKKLISMARELNNDESGASFIEYTVLIGVILVLSIATISAVGLWANNRWTLLNTTVNP